MHCQAESAPNFNLFSILGVEDKEVSTHSAFLAHLLTPGEAHAQGDIFLRHFLLELCHVDLASFDDWAVSRELPFDGGRLDIVIQSAKASTIIVVENKIDTEDHVNQLPSYRDFLDARRRRSFKTRLLLYLTPTGDLAKNARTDIYKPISYSGDIAQWLSSCLPEVKAQGVKHSIETYLRTIKNLNTKTFMKDDLDESVLSLINTPADRSAALRILRIGKSLKREILQKFWDKGEAYLKKNLAGESPAYWRLERTEDSPLISEYGIGIVGTGVDKEKPQPHPRFVFFQKITETLFRWEFVVRFDYSWKAQQKITALPEAQKLADVMDGALSMPKKHGWDGYMLYTEDSKGIERTLEDEITKQTGVGEVSDFFEVEWKKFKQLEPHLRRLNQAALRLMK